MKLSEDWLGRKLREKLPTSFSIYSFESCGVFCVPDLYVVHPKCFPFWVELKAVDSLDCQVDFQRGQPEWLENHARAGGYAAVVVLVRVPGYIAIFPGSGARRLAAGKVRFFPSLQALWTPLSAPECWARVANGFLGLFPAARDPKKTV